MDVQTSPIRKSCLRYNDTGHAHELTFSCLRRQALLMEDRIRGYFAEAVTKARERHRFVVWSYVIMPEHIHLLVHPREAEYSISDILHGIKQSVARRELIHLRKHNPDGLSRLATGQRDTLYRFWQDGGGYDRNVTSPTTLQEMVAYIHNNPVRRGLVTQSTDWSWSSARDWEGTGQGPIPMDRSLFPAS